MKSSSKICVIIGWNNFRVSLLKNKKMLLSIIIPAYNEERYIKKILERIFSLRLNLDLEVIVVDDGSTDSTAQKVENSKLPVILIRQERNQGKGSAIIKGLNKARGEFVLIQDADLEYSPEDYPEIIKPIISGRADVVYGSRILNNDNSYSYRHYYWGGRLLSWWTNFLYQSRLTDESTGYKVFRTSLLKSLELKCRGFEFCPEVTAKVLKSGVRIIEVPITYSPRDFTAGKKIRPKDGLMALWVLLKLRFKKIPMYNSSIKIKNILYVSLFGYLGGGEMSLLSILKNLDRNKFLPYVISYTDGPLIKKIKELNIEVIVLNRKSFFSNFSVILKIFRFIKKRNIDLVHVNSLDIRAGLASFFSGVPFIGHLRVIFAYTWRDYLFVCFSNKVISVSNAATNHFCEHFSNCRPKFITIANAVVIPDKITPLNLREEFGIAQGVKLIGAVGRIDPLKGYEYFIESASLLKKEYSNLAFIIIGDVFIGNQEEEDYLALLKKRIADLNMQDYFFFAGFRDNILENIAALDIVVVSSIELIRGRQMRTEGFGRVAIEAMSVGVPVVASNIGGLKEIIDDGVCGLFVAPKDPLEIKEAVLKLLNNSQLRETIISEGKKKVERLFSIQRQIGLISRVYEEITSSANEHELHTNRQKFIRVN